MSEQTTRVRGERAIPDRGLGALAPFAFQDFRLLWSGLLVSNLGNWMQFTSLTYLVGVVLAHSASESSLNLGLLGASQALPGIVVSMIAGYIADKYPRRRTLIIASTARVVLATAMAVISLGTGQYVLIGTLAISGLFAAAAVLDGPARNSWVSSIVPRRYLGNAIGFVGIAFNTPLMIGPAIAGIIIGTAGVYASFLINAVGQASVLIAAIMMKPAPPSKASEEPMLQQIAEGLRYVMSHSVLRWIAVVQVVTYIGMRPYAWLLATFASRVLYVDARAYGLMLAAGGVGTAAGSVLCAFWRSERRSGLLFIATFVTGSGLLVLGYLHNFALVMGVLVALGFGTITFATTTSVLSQMLAPDELRGRAISIQTMFAQGLIPLGTLLMGSIASFAGIPLVYAVNGALGLACGAWIWIRHPKVRSV